MQSRIVPHKENFAFGRPLQNTQGSFAEQLAPLATRNRVSTATVRKVSQIALRIVGGVSQTNNFEIARRNCLSWISERAGHELPRDAWDGVSFELEDVGAQRTSVVSLSNPRAWAARLDDADDNTPRRYWPTEIAIAYGDGDSVLFACRVQCTTLGEDKPFTRSIPRVVRKIVDVMPAYVDGRKVSLKPWIISSETDVDELVDFISRKNRGRSVLVFSLPDGSEDPSQTIFPVDSIIRRTVGATHVAIITGPVSFHLSDRVGREFSVFRQAVRSYQPMLNLETDQPFEHPLSLPNKIITWPDRGSDGFADFLVERILSATVTGRDIEDEMPTFLDFKRAALEISRSEAIDGSASDSELLELAEQEIDQLKVQLEETTQTTTALISQADDEISQLKAAVNQLREDNSNQKARISHLSDAVRNRESDEGSAPIPSDFANLDEWSRQHLAGSVFIHNRAIRAAKKSNFADVGLAYTALIILRDYYVPMRIEGGLEKKREYEKCLATASLEESPTFAGARAGEQGEAYFVDFGGKRRELDRHLKGSNSRDERFGFRLYFFWDDETEQVVVGWLPSHLPNRAS
jgi:hypothetical protein